MAKSTIIQSNFNAGELSPDLAGHIDIDRYANGAKEMVNAIPQLTGGAKRRGGFRIISAAKTIGTERLIPFVFNKDQAYVLEFGNLFARFFTKSGQIVVGSTPLEIATPYASNVLFEIEYAQSADTMFTAHASLPMQRLLRLGQTSWRFGQVPFDPSPIGENGVRPATSLVLSGTTGIVTATSGASAFSPSDVGRTLIAGSGQADITAYISATQVTLSVSVDFAATSYAANAWKIGLSPQVAITPSNSGPENGPITLVADGPPVIVSQASLTASTMTITTQDPHGLAVGNQVVLSGFESAGLDGTYSVVSVPDATHFTFTFNGSLLAGSTLGLVYKFGAGVAWRPTDVGSFVDINGGIVEITQYVDASKVYGRIVSPLTATVTAPANSWSLKSAVWNPVDGYPRAVSLYQQRLYAAGTTGFPTTLWATRIGLYFDFTPGTDDDDAFSYVAASDQVNQVQHLASARVLTVLTQGEEFTVDGGSSASVTPTNINIRSQSIFGSAQARPVRAANEVIYFQRAAKKVRSMAYDFNTDSFRSQDLTRLAQHITESGIVDATYKSEPNPEVWMVRADGVLVSMTYSRDENVVGFARHTTQGKFKSVACIPGDEGDVLFALVERTVNGSTVQYVERLDESVMTDAAITGTTDTPTDTWFGFSMLEDCEVDVKADGVYMGTMTVTGGQIKLPRTASSIEVGLHYDSHVTALTPNLSSGITTTQGNRMRSGEVIVRLLNTIGLRVNGQLVPFREFGEGILDKPPQPFTGDKDITNDGWDVTSEITLTQDQPYAWYVLALIRQYTVNNG